MSAPPARPRLVLQTLVPLAGAIALVAGHAHPRTPIVRGIELAAGVASIVLGVSLGIVLVRDLRARRRP